MLPNCLQVATVEDLEALVADAAPETDVLEFKGGRYASSDDDRWSGGHELAKDVAAFANHRGGQIVVGLRQNDAGRAKTIAPITGVGVEQLERQMRQWLVRHLSPPVDVSFTTIAVADGLVAVVDVPRSDRQPHAVDPGSGRIALVYPVRDGSDVKWLREHDVARRYAERFQGIVARKARLDALISDANVWLMRGPALWMWVAVEPERLLSRTLDRGLVAAIERWASAGVMAGPMHSTVHTSGGIVGAGSVTFTTGRVSEVDDETQPGSSYLELHADGCAFVAVDIAERTGPDVGVGERSLIDCLIPAVDVSTRWAAETAAPGDVATVAFGLFSSTDDTSDVQLVAAGSGGGMVRVSSSRPIPRGGAGQLCRDETIADLDACGTPTGRIQIVHAAASRLLQRFGKAEPDGVTAAGAVNVAGWRSDRSWVERWAREHDVQFDNG